MQLYEAIMLLIAAAFVFTVCDEAWCAFKRYQARKNPKSPCRDCPFSPYQQKKSERREGARRSDRA